MNIGQQLINLIEDQLEIKDEVTLNNKLVDIGYDSLKFIELVIKIESFFEIEFEDEYLSYHKFETVSEVEEYISSKVKTLV
jgi:acyl carrier protein